MEALIGGGVDRTYLKAAELSGVSECTLLTHFNRVRKRHPELYRAVRAVRLAQPADRHEDALAEKRAHGAMFFRKRSRNIRRWFR